MTENETTWANRGNENKTGILLPVRSQMQAAHEKRLLQIGMSKQQGIVDNAAHAIKNPK
jgi:hypothetical protein